MNTTFYPQLLVFREKWVAVSGDAALFFDAAGRLLPKSIIDLQAASRVSPIHALCVVGYYLLALRDSGAHVYNLLDFSEVQQIEFDKDWLFHALAIDCDNVLVAEDVPVSAAKKEFTSRLTYLRAVSFEEQIRQMLSHAGVEKAFKVFEQNVAHADPSYERKKEHFDLEAAWALFRNMEFVRAVDFFLRANYDPRELLALVPGMLEREYKSLKMLVEERAKQVSDPPRALAEGAKTIIRLVEEKLKFIQGKFDLKKDLQKTVTFLTPDFPINALAGPKSCTVEGILRLLNTALLKLYVEQRDIARLASFISNSQPLLYSEDAVEKYLSERKAADRSCATHVCQALLAERLTKYTDALEIWRSLGEATREVREMACRETARLLRTHVPDKSTLFKYARMVLMLNLEEGLQIFTQGEDMDQVASEAEVLQNFESLEQYQPEIRERYIQHLIRKEEPQEWMFTMLGLIYVGRVKMMGQGEQILTQAQREDALRVLDQFLQDYREKYNEQSLLEGIKNLGLYKQETFLYTLQKNFDEALNSYIKLGEREGDFKDAEEYCEDSDEPLFAKLFEKLISAYQEARAKMTALRAGLDYEEAKKKAVRYEKYCKKFLRRHAANEKMDVAAVIKAIPDDWPLTDDHDTSLSQYVALALKDRLGKDIAAKIARNTHEMQKLDLIRDQIKMQRAYVVISGENVCRVCGKKLGGAKALCVFPNGVVTHNTCVKNPGVCPVTRVNFAKKVYL